MEPKQNAGKGNEGPPAPTFSDSSVHYEYEQPTTLLPHHSLTVPSLKLSLLFECVSDVACSTISIIYRCKTSFSIQVVDGIFLCNMSHGLDSGSPDTKPSKAVWFVSGLVPLCRLCRLCRQGKPPLTQPLPSFSSFATYGRPDVTLQLSPIMPKKPPSARTLF